MIDQQNILSDVVVPAARVDDLVMTETADELLVYDTVNHHIHHLNHTSAVIWRLCNGQRSVTELARLATVELDEKISEDAVRLALTKFSETALLNGALARSIRVTGQSRRKFLRKAAAAVALPAIVSVSAPSATMAMTVGCFEDCNNNNSACNDGACPQCGPGSGSGSGTVCCHNSQPPFLCD